jgi:putative flippase GtrA
MRNRMRATQTDMTRHLSRFVVVGAIGIVIQLVSLHLYAKVVGLHYLVATVAAVETTLLQSGTDGGLGTIESAAARTRRC